MHTSNSLGTLRLDGVPSNSQTMGSIRHHDDVHAGLTYSSSCQRLPATLSQTSKSSRSLVLKNGADDHEDDGFVFHEGQEPVLDTSFDGLDEICIAIQHTRTEIHKKSNPSKRRSKLTKKLITSTHTNLHGRPKVNPRKQINSPKLGCQQASVIESASRSNATNPANSSEAKESHLEPMQQGLAEGDPLKGEDGTSISDDGPKLRRQEPSRPVIDIEKWLDPSDKTRCWIDWNRSQIITDEQLNQIGSKVHSIRSLSLCSWIPTKFSLSSSPATSKNGVHCATAKSPLSSFTQLRSLSLSCHDGIRYACTKSHDARM